MSLAFVIFFPIDTNSETMADINSSTASTSSGGRSRSLLLERLARKKRAALRKTVPVARDEEELQPPRMDPVLDFPSEDGWEEPSSVVRHLTEYYHFMCMWCLK